jgi:hypothetical protein
MAATAAVIIAGAPPLVVYAAAIVAAVPFTIARPTQAALLPSVARTPDELTAANVVSNWCEGVGIVGGPVLAGLVVGPGGPGAVLAVFAAVGLASGIVVWPVRDAAQPASNAGDDDDGAGLLGGLAALRADPTTGFLVGMVGSQAIVLGALDVLNVVLAFQIIDTGRSGVAYLNAAFGAGGIVGGLVTVALVGRRRLAPPLLAGGWSWGVARSPSSASSARPWARSSCSESPERPGAWWTCPAGPCCSARATRGRSRGCSVSSKAWTWRGMPWAA